MKNLICNIQLGSINFDWVNDIDIETSWEKLTDTATIVLPAKIKINNLKLSKDIKSGDRVVIKCGYREDEVKQLTTIYTGYVTYVKPRVPVEISCEDEMFKLKQTTLKDSGKKAQLSDLLIKHFPTYKTDALNVEIGDYYIDNVSAAKYLEGLKSDFGLYSFFRGNTLVVGKRYNAATAKHHKFKLEYNIISDDLEYKRKDQIKLKVKAISNNSTGKKITIELGEKDGETRTLNFYNKSEKELKKAAEREMKRLVYDGWRGSFTVFGEPIVKHGDIVQLSYDEAVEKTGKYWVDAVKYSFGLSGFRQEIKLGSVA